MQKQMNGDKTRPLSITYDYRSPDSNQGVQLHSERQMKEEANVQAIFILWVAFAVLLPFDAALAQATNPTTVQKIALAAVGPMFGVSQTSTRTARWRDR